MATSAAEITLDFSKDGVLPTDLNGNEDDAKSGIFTIGGYSLTVEKCYATSGGKQLCIAPGGSISFTATKTIKSVKFNVYSNTSSTMNLYVGDESVATLSKQTKGAVNTLEVPAGTETKGKVIKIASSKKVRLLNVTFVIEGSVDPSEPDTPTASEWMKVLKYNDDSEVENGASLPVGQVLKLESQVDGFMANSAIDNNYVVVYTVNGKAPTFNGKKGGSSAYWNDPDSNNGIYIYRRGIALEGKAGEEVTVTVSVFETTASTSSESNATTYKCVNTFSKKFTLTESTRPTSSDFKLAPSTTSSHEGKDLSEDVTVLDITESCTATGKKGNTVIAKYSSNSNYNIQQLLNAANISLDNTTAGVFSTQYKLRKTSAIQITSEGIVSSDVARAFYWYIPARKNLILEAVPSYRGLSMTGVKQDKVTLRGYYMDGTAKKYVDLSQLAITITSNDPKIATIEGELTYPDENDKTTATFLINAVDNGTTKINIHTAQTSNVVCPKNSDGDETATNYNAAATDVTVKVVDGATMAPPTITPETSEYHVSFKSSIQADASYSAYYWVDKSLSTVDPQSIPSPEEVKNNGVLIEKGQKVETDIEAGDGNVYTVYAVSYDAETEELGKRVVSSTYTYVKIENPVLTPGTEGVNNYYAFDDDKLTIVASVATAGAQVYYTINTAITEVTKDNGTLYDGKTKINISESSIIRAVAYKNGIYSDVVTYRYNKQKTDIEAPKYYVDDAPDPVTEYANIGEKKITLKATYTDADGNEGTIDENNKMFHIYYTTDGSLPTTNSNVYVGPFQVSGTVNKIIAYVLADGEGGDLSISDRSVLVLTNSNLHVWQTTEENCPNGVLKENQAELYDEAGNTLEVKAEFGGFATEADKRDNKQVWDHYTSKETSKGTPIDGVGKYSIAPNIDAKDEMGVLYNHSKANTGAADYSTHKSTYLLPSMGAYTKFEPNMDGKLTIYCFQEGALYYADRIGTKECFNSQFLRKRPVYFVDEAGVSIAPSDVEASGTLSSKWKDVESDNFVDRGGQQNGIQQNLFTKTQTENIYKMFNDVITNNTATQETSLTNLLVYINDGSHDAVAGYGLPGFGDADEDKLALAKTGVCLPSASFMKYTFNVEAGKTYFFFGWMTKLGIRGFGFEPDAEQPTGNLTIKAGKADTDKQTFEKGKKYATATLNRTFKKDLWTTLVLPFSVSASEVKRVFGDDAQILHYRTIQGNTMYFFKHYHQMIVAGTPILVKPSKDINEYPTFNHVKIEAANVVDEPCNDYGYKGEADDTQYRMVGSYSPQTVTKGSFYLSAKDGSVKQLLYTDKSTLSGTCAYMTGTSTNTPLSLAKSAYDNLTPIDMNGETTEIDFIETDSTSEPIRDDKVYNVNGQLVRQNAKSLDGLAKGIYIIDGKKVVVE